MESSRGTVNPLLSPGETGCEAFAHAVPSPPPPGFLSRRICPSDSPAYKASLAQELPQTPICAPAFPSSLSLTVIKSSAVFLLPPDRQLQRDKAHTSLGQHPSPWKNPEGPYTTRQAVRLNLVISRPAGPTAWCPSTYQRALLCSLGTK